MESNDNPILPGFNLRDESCFLEIYRSLYGPMLHFADSLFGPSETDPEDVLNDLFMQLWSKKSLQFNTVNELKAYLYTSIRNRFKNNLRKNKKVQEYRQHAAKEINELLFAQVVESEIYGQLNVMENLLPQECAKVFRLLVEGYEVNEIAAKMAKSPSTIYDHRNNAIRIIRKTIISR